MNEMPGPVADTRWYVSRCRRDLVRAVAKDLRIGTDSTREDVSMRQYFLAAAEHQLELVLGVGHEQDV